jgi:subtilisin family serine protease
VVAEVTGEQLDRIAEAGFEVIDRSVSGVLGGEIARLRLPDGLGIDVARTRIRVIAPAAILDENHLYRPVEMPCKEGNCPAFEMIGWVVPPARCALAATLGMIDTVVNADHPGLRDQALEKVSVLSAEDSRSAAVHGTAVAALLVGDGESRTPGLLPNARLVAVEAFHRDRAGDASDVYKIVRGMDALEQRAIRVVNMSFGGPPNAVLERAVERAAEGGMILVAAAANRGPNAEPAYPGAYPGALAVTAIDRSRRVYRQAGRGEHIDFSAPGVRLWTAASVSGGRFRSGTSYAVPFVSAAIAAALARHADRTSAEILDGLAATSIDLGEAGRDATYGWGLVTASGCGAETE